MAYSNQAYAIRNLLNSQKMPAGRLGIVTQNGMHCILLLARISDTMFNLAHFKCFMRSVYRINTPSGHTQINNCGAPAPIASKPGPNS